MKPREKQLWKWLDGGKPAGCLLRRVEDSTQDDFPDVLGKHKDHAFMVELKVASLRRDGTVKIDLSAGQATFARTWGSATFRVWIFIQVPEWGRFLILGNHSKEIALRPMSIERLIELSEIPQTAIPVQVIERMAR